MIWDQAQRVVLCRDFSSSMPASNAAKCCKVRDGTAVEPTRGDTSMHVYCSTLVSKTALQRAPRHHHHHLRRCHWCVCVCVCLPLARDHHATDPRFSLETTNSFREGGRCKVDVGCKSGRLGAQSMHACSCCNHPCTPRGLTIAERTNKRRAGPRKDMRASARK
jgi:hypothetical protein